MLVQPTVAVSAARGVRVHRNAAVTQVSAGRLHASSGEWVYANEMVWVTRAGGAVWLQDTGLALDADGFIHVTDTLQTVTDSNILAAGDIAAMAQRHTGYGVKPEHYTAVGESLSWTLEKGLGKDWTPEVKEAWETCYGLLASIMITASAEAPAA